MIIYLDNNATTKVAPEAIEIMVPLLDQNYGNPSSMHTLGWQASKYVQEGRDQLAKLLNCKAEEILFTGTGTESDNLALRSIELMKDKTHIITTRVEHSAIKNTASYLQEKGYSITYLGVNEFGQLDLEELQKELREETGLVSIMYANNETGVIFPIPEIAKIVKAHGALLHVDAIQAIGKIPIDLKAIPIDMLSVSGHKFHAIKGIGALYLRRGTRVKPVLYGGQQEKGIRPGTTFVPGIAVMGKAAQLAKTHLENMKNIQKLRDHLEKSLTEKISYTHINGDVSSRLPNTSNISFSGCEGEAILMAFSQKGICASVGSACNASSIKISETLKAMKVPRKFLNNSIRFSLSRYTTEEEIEYAIEHVPPIIEKLRKVNRRK